MGVKVRWPQDHLAALQVEAEERRRSALQAALDLGRRSIPFLGGLESSVTVDWATIYSGFLKQFPLAPTQSVLPSDNGAGNSLLGGGGCSGGLAGGGYGGGLLAPAPADDPKPAAEAAPVASKPANPALARAMGRSARLPIGFAVLS